MTYPSARSRGMYGKRPADPRRPRIALSRVLTGVVPAHPLAVDYLARLAAWQMLGNDVKGNCVAVTWANTRRLVTSVLATEHYPTRPMVDRIYATQNPGSQDNGMDIQTLLGWLTANAGPDGAKAIGFASVDYTNPAEVEAAIAIFGSVWVGFNVTAANETEFDQGKPWDYVSGSPDVGGHSVITGGYGTGSGQLAGMWDFETWAEVTSFTDALWSRQVDECWVVIWPEHLGSAAFLEGVDLAAFAAAYTQITGKPFPVPVPVVPPGPDPVPPQPAAADLALYTATLDWSKARHTGTNKLAAADVRAWAVARNLGFE